ncbi:membrane associated rhomboid family serine protease [Balneicella halophila]|uniref:Membrane associated rhomboid family serine protease n=1 Tax=Balneicella halophila TaxID=1537566 RepID=A0A7L4URQ7_BALHA|nr:rhomboid family intramembrane serine protease [Balneicella halophila]PVX51009.1 membrane associated rhomboid family serine protease [Balneicella halophila]
MDAIEFNKKLRLSIFIPLLLTLTMWFVKVYEWLFDDSLVSFGIMPRKVEHLYGILFSPIIHSDWSHLWANTIPFFVLSTSLFFFYRTIATKTFLIMYIGSGFLLWCIGRESYHIGMSGIIYALATFLMVSGLIKKNYRLTALALIVVFLYGSLFWGLFPIEKQVSWEGHISGALIGLVLAVIFKNKGPQPPVILSEDDEDDETIPEEIWNAENIQKENPEDTTPTNQDATF